MVAASARLRAGLRSVAVGTLLAGTVVAATAQAAERKIASIDLYGMRTVAEADVRAALALAAGQPLPEDLGPLIMRLRSVPGVRDAAVDPVCCVGQDWILFVGIEELGSEALRRREPPDGEESLVDAIVTAYAAWRAASARAERSGLDAEDWSEGHALSEEFAVREQQLRFVELADGHFDNLRSVLGRSRHAPQREVAAEVIGYASDKRAVLPILLEALRDPNPGVRGNAIRAVGILADYAQSRPELQLEIDSRPLIEMVNSPSWSDRNKAMLVLEALTKNRDPALLARLRREALPALREMASWNSPAHSFSAVAVLGRIAGLNEAAIIDRWSANDRRSWVDSIGTAAPAGN